MLQKIRTITLCLLTVFTLHSVAQGNGPIFNEWFEDATLRMDYVLTGHSKQTHVALDDCRILPHWAGRRGHLDHHLLKGNGRLTLSDKQTKQTIYVTTFSTLYQEWLATNEAKGSERAFEQVFQAPLPKRDAVATLLLYDTDGDTLACVSHDINPKDILWRRDVPATLPPHRLLRQATCKTPINVAIVAEGYKLEEAEQFFAAAEVACQSIFAHKPFNRFESRFNMLAVALPSAESGVSVPRLGEWHETALASHFSTFYSDRYLTTLRLKQVYDALAGLNFDHIIILANTTEYGGGGIYNAYTLTTAGHRLFRPVVVHEFGHSFAGLGDEYAENGFETLYAQKTEPWEPNITSLVDFEAKWKDMLPPGTAIPTRPTEGDSRRVGVYEGAGYVTKGLYRPTADCRMRTNECSEFCPVCQRAIERIIRFYTEE